MESERGTCRGAGWWRGAVRASAPAGPGPGAPGTRRRRRRRRAQARAPGPGRDRCRRGQERGAGPGWGGAGFLGDAVLAWQSEITTGRACVRASERASGGRGAGEARAAGRGCSRGRWRWQRVPERGGRARGRGEGFGDGVGVGATTTAPLSRDEAGVLLSRCALPGSRCAPNFKTLGTCWRSVGVNLDTSSLAFWLGVCVRACRFVRLSFLVAGGK